VTPYLGYGFYGRLPDGGPKLNEALAYGARAGVQLTPQFAAYGEYQRSTPHTDGATEHRVTVDHWSAGVEFSYIPRGGAVGMLPVLLEAGVGQAPRGGQQDPPPRPLRRGWGRAGPAPAPGAARTQEGGHAPGSTQSAPAQPLAPERRPEGRPLRARRGALPGGRSAR
jgi:hypothetical protein